MQRVQDQRAQSLAERNAHLENILLVFFESLFNSERTCALLSKDELEVLESALDAARRTRESA